MNHREISAIAKLPGTSCEIVFNPAEISTSLRNLLVRYFSNYPHVPRYGWSSKTGQIAEHLMDLFEIPDMRISNEGIKLDFYKTSIPTAQWQEFLPKLYDLCLADATVRRMTQNSDWYLRNLQKQLNSAALDYTFSSTQDLMRDDSVVTALRVIKEHTPQLKRVIEILKQKEPIVLKAHN